MDRKDAYKLGYKGYTFHNGKGTVRQVVEDAKGPAKDRVVRWKKIQGDGPDEGTTKWATWRRWCVAEWFEPRPERLPVPEITRIDQAFPTGRVTPPWRWVPDEFRNKPGGEYENRDNPWVRLVSDVFMGTKSWADWQALPKEGIDPQKAFEAVDVAMRNWGQKHEQKMATCGWMLSEWFKDFWFKGDTHTAVHRQSIPEDSE